MRLIIKLDTPERVKEFREDAKIILGWSAVSVASVGIAVVVVGMKIGAFNFDKQAIRHALIDRPRHETFQPKQPTKKPVNEAQAVKYTFE